MNIKNRKKIKKKERKKRGEKEEGGKRRRQSKKWLYIEKLKIRNRLRKLYLKIYHNYFKKMILESREFLLKIYFKNFSLFLILFLQILQLSLILQFLPFYSSQ